MSQPGVYMGLDLFISCDSEGCDSYGETWYSEPIAAAKKRLEDAGWTMPMDARKQIPMGTHCPRCAAMSYEALETQAAQPNGGRDPDFTGELSTDEYIREIRGAQEEKP